MNKIQAPRSQASWSSVSTGQPTKFSWFLPLGHPPSEYADIVVTHQCTLWSMYSSRHHRLMQFFSKTVSTLIMSEFSWKKKVLCSAVVLIYFGCYCSVFIYCCFSGSRQLLTQVQAPWHPHGVLQRNTAPLPTPWETIWCWKLTVTSLVWVGEWSKLVQMWMCTSFFFKFVILSTLFVPLGVRDNFYIKQAHVLEFLKCQK